MVKLRKHIRLVIFVALVVVAVIGTVGYFGILANRPSSSTEQKKPLTTAKEKVSQLLDSDDPAVVTQAQQQLQKLADSEPDPTIKAVYISGLAQSYAASNDYTSALSFSKQAEVADPTAITAATIGAYAQESGDFALAAKYFGIAASRSDNPNDPTKNTPYNDYMVMKREAEASMK